LEGYSQRLGEELVGFMRYLVFFLMILSFKSFAVGSVKDDTCASNEQKYDRHEAIIDDVKRDEFLSLFYLVELKVVKVHEFLAVLYQGDHIIKVVYKFTGACTNGKPDFEKSWG
jgi:hypothetical protein